MAVVAVVFGATAYACTALATLDAPSQAVSPGGNVAVSGAGFSAKAGSPVVLHWNGASGPELARTSPDAAGNIKATFAVPTDAKPGFQVLVATQAGSDGKPIYGTPARASIEVNGAQGSTPVAPGTPAANPTSNPSEGNGVLLVTLAIGAAGLALFGAGFASTVRHGRRRQPATSKVGRG